MAARGAPLRFDRGFAARPRLGRSYTTTRDTTQRDIHDAAVAQSMTKTPAVRAVIWPARLINRPNAWEAWSWHVKMELQHKHVGLS